MNFRIFFIISFFVTLISCNAKDMSEREESIFSQEYHKIAIPVDSLKTLNDLTDYLYNQYCVKNVKQAPFLIFDMKAHKVATDMNRHSIIIGIEPPPCNDGKYDATMILEIVKNGYNTEIEHYITEIDSIPSYVRKQMLSYGKDNNYAIGAYQNGIWLCTKKEDKLENLNQYIYQIIIGYLESFREYSNLAYNKSIDKLSEQEYEEIASEFDFHLSFKYTDKTPSVSVDAL